MRQSDRINLRLHAGQDIPRRLVAKRIGIGLHRQHAAAVAAQDKRIFPFEVKAADHVTERNILLAALAPDQHVVQVIRVLALSGRGADDHWQQVGSLAVQARAAAGEVHLQRVINILFIYPQLAPKRGGVLRADDFAAVLPVIPDTIGSQICGENIANLAGEQAQAVGVRTFNPHLNGAVAGRAEHHAFRAGVYLRVVARNIAINMLRQGGNIALIVHAHHDLRIVAVLPLSAIGEDKPHAALANGGHGGDHPGLAVNGVLNIAGHLFGGRDIGTVREPEIDKENRRI